jgi:hypothetical protein
METEAPRLSPYGHTHGLEEILFPPKHGAVDHLHCHDRKTFSRPSPYFAPLHSLPQDFLRGERIIQRLVKISHAVAKEVEAVDIDGLKWTTGDEA